jgi:protein-L-isoaspartate O-methyltransferase
VIGIDRDAEVIEEARRRARLAGAENVEFAVADAEAGEYHPFAPDLVVAHLCMSDAIVERTGRALARGSVLAFVAFHADQWRETGRRSRFAYDEGQMAALLERTGFAVEILEVDRREDHFALVEEGLAAAVSLQERWRADGRWFNYIKYLEGGGRTLTRAHLVVKARRR